MKTFKFYGVCGNQYKLNDTIWEAIEDEGDGYRSYLNSIIKVESDAIFQYEPIAEVYVEFEDTEEFKGYRFIDVEDKHEWLVIGTGYYDAWYPCFIFSYSIKDKELSNNNIEDEENEWENFIN